MNASPSHHRSRVVLYDGPGARRLDEARRFEVTLALLEEGHAVTRAASTGTVAPADDVDHVVLGEYQGGVPEPAPESAGSVFFRDIAGLDAGGVARLVSELLEEGGRPEPAQWKPWFPVIDYDRCTNCMQCLSFCLFDVYGVDGAEKIQVQNESNCKTDCPACSRVCPDAAILFPKYKSGPINGDVVRGADLQREAMKVDISALLGGDIYGALRKRSDEAKKRFSTERDESRALLERKRCLAKLKEDLDIPDEVLMTLPSSDAIEDRARRAKEKAERRRARSQTVKDQTSKPPPSADDWDI